VSDARIAITGIRIIELARGIDPMITLGSDREFGAASLAKAKGWSTNSDDSTVIEKVA
jgi:hypothetical protein